MIYKEFREKLGELIIPSGQIYDELIEGNDSIHCIIIAGIIDGSEYKMNDYFDDNHILLKTIDILESRGAIRNRDYIVTGNIVGNEIRLGIHSTHKYLSDEDFDVRVKRYYK